MLDRVPASLQPLLRRLVLKLRIPLNQVRSFYNLWRRRWSFWLSSELVPWRRLDLRGPGVRSFCISLLDDPRFQERRDLFQRYAKEYGWEVDFWPAVNGSRFDSAEYPDWVKCREKADNGEPFGAGAIGLLMTVKDIYQWAWDQQLEHLVIFEDDAVVHGSPRLELPAEFDIVFFNNRIQGDRRGRVIHGWGNDGYVISRRGIEKMLAILQDVTADIDMLMLMYIRSLAERGHYMTKLRDKSKPQLDCYHVGPIVTHAGYFASSIGMMSAEADSGQDVASRFNRSS